MTQNQYANVTSVTKQAKLWITLSYASIILSVLVSFTLSRIFFATEGIYGNSVLFMTFSYLNGLLSPISILFLFLCVRWLNRLNFIGIHNAVVKFKLSIWFFVFYYLLEIITGLILMCLPHDFVNSINTINYAVLMPNLAMYASSYFMIAAIVELRKSAAPAASKYLKMILICTFIYSMKMGLSYIFSFLRIPPYVSVEVIRQGAFIALYIFLIINWQKFLSLSDKVFIKGESPKISFKPEPIEWYYIGYAALMTMSRIYTIISNYFPRIHYD